MPCCYKFQVLTPIPPIGLPFSVGDDCSSITSQLALNREVDFKAVGCLEALLSLQTRVSTCSTDGICSTVVTEWLVDGDTVRSDFVLKGYNGLCVITKTNTNCSRTLALCPSDLVSLCWVSVSAHRTPVGFLW